MQRLISFDRAPRVGDKSANIPTALQRPHLWESGIRAPRHGQRHTPRRAREHEVAAFGIKVTIVEPGDFRTEFAGDANMRPAQPPEAYRPVIAPIEQCVYGQAGRQPGDPVKAADLMIAAVDAATPPLRLMLGADACELWDRTVAARNAELDAWRSRGEATAYPHATMIPIGSA